MNEPKFTKGPWYRANYSARSAATGKFLAHTDSNSLDESERLANAALIAAAPEMYEMLKHVLGSPYCVDMTGLPSHEDVKMLLAKARGEQ